MEPPDEYCLSPDCFADQGIEIIPGEKSNSEWLVLNDLYILHKYRSFKNGNVVWECKHVDFSYEIMLWYKNRVYTVETIY